MEKQLQLHDELLTCLNQGKIECMVAKGAEIFNSSLIITDANYHCIASFPQEKQGDKVFDDMTEFGYIQDELLQSYLDTYLTSQTPYYEPFYVDEPPVGQQDDDFQPRIFAQIVSNKEIIGHIGILLGSQPLESWHLSAAQIFSTYTATLLNLQAQKYPVKGKEEHLLIKFLDLSFKSLRTDEVLESFQQTFPSPWSLILSNISLTSKHVAYSTILLDNIKSAYPDSVCIIYEDYLAILLPDTTNSLLTLDICMTLNNFGYHYNMLYGDHLNSEIITKAYRTADDLFPLLINREDPFYYVENHLLLLAGKLLTQDRNKNFFIHPILKIIEKHDEDEKTDYYTTLVTLFRNNFDFKKTAEELFIHRNTLRYRMNRMEELFGIDFTSNKLIQQLQLGIFMEEHY